MMFLYIFWTSCFVLVFHIVLYPMILWLLTKKNRLSNGTPLQTYPSVTVVCPAFNEQSIIEAKINSFLSIDYPKDKVKMIIISDESTDLTNEIVQRYLDENIELVVQSPRGGKQKAHNLIQPDLQSDYVLSTDANSVFEPDAVRQLVSVMRSNPKIGIVSGELKLKKKNDKDSGEGLYWKYECFVKKMDSKFKSIIGSNGSIYLIRRELFTQISPDTIDDFERTLYVLSQGYYAYYVPQAIVTEDVTEKAHEEIKRKIRIITREWVALNRYKTLLNPFKFGRISFILISHKLIRWLFFLMMISMLLSCAYIDASFYRFVFYCQIMFYLVGVIGLMSQRLSWHIPGIAIITYITAMGWSSLIAFISFIFGIKSGVWTPVRKQV